tara:strand:+ start:457 stop:579 length:123 start_codon:yes stop_codon:yes gene_type:complete
VNVKIIVSKISISVSSMDEIVILADAALAGITNVAVSLTL